MADYLGSNRPQSGRVWDYLLWCGKNCPADRDLVASLGRARTYFEKAARRNQTWLYQVTRWASQQWGVRQFVDLGAGVGGPVALHENIRRQVPSARVVYVESDLVACCSLEQDTRDVPGTAVIEADLTQPRTLLDHPVLRTVLDFDQPVAVLLSAVLHEVPDDRDPAGVLAAWRDAVVPGSLAAISHLTADDHPQVVQQAVEVYAEAGMDLHPRTRAEVASLAAEFGPVTAPEPLYPPLWKPERLVIAHSLVRPPSECLTWSVVVHRGPD
ncbi:SAM-dependent methyltransferase [Kutzneria albida]|uniref:SAM-dependent methyltransferase n=1 Tax=Kutzneria albida TaxID=43357 RepID=UPI00130EA638|nr:SAM-dependent methyltransferase [Kutzneria albida]